MTVPQTPMLSKEWDSSYDVPPISRCHQIWDTRTARFTPCSLPFISSIPVVVGALILLTYLLRAFNPYRPRWTKPFVEEPKEILDELDQSNQHQTLSATFGLLALTSIGLVLQIVDVFSSDYQMSAICFTVAWGIGTAIVVIERPKTAPSSLFVLFVTLFLAYLSVLSQTHTSLAGKDAPLVLAPVAALVGIFVILNMPLRSPYLPKQDISEVFSAPTAKLRTPEDNLTPWQYMTVSWMDPLIQKGATKNMEEDDVWDLGFEFKHERLHATFRELSGSVTKRIFVANGMDLVRTTSLSLVQLAATLASPILLQRILASMNDPLSPRTATLTYALIALALRWISAQCNVFNLWFQRRSYERSRGEMITMLYEKTLNRKILGAKPEVKDEPQDDVSNGEPQEAADDESLNASEPSPQGWLGSLSSSMRSLFTRPKNEPKREKDAASMGKILNIMRGDVYEVSQRFWDFSDIIIKPVGAIFAILLIWRMLGWACLLGVLALIASQLINVVVARYQVYFERKRRAATDEKLQRTTQFIESIRHLRWYGWQEAWLSDISESRKNELHYRVILMVFSTSMNFILRFGAGLFPVVAFYAFTALAKKPLRVDLIFPAMDLFNLLGDYLRALPNLLTTLLNAYVAMGRIEDFMNEPDKEQVDAVSEQRTELALHNASFAWPGVNKNILEDVNLSFPPGLTVIYGPVAAGKTALLQALLGELDISAGEVISSNQVVGYCSQTPWLQSMSIRDNILFSYPFEEARYMEVLEACQLKPDMAEFKHGDLSNIGENGIGLSGGQKARVALARAVYSNAQILLLDDPLSALDFQTSESIVQRLLAGRLLGGRTTILVTHRTELCHGIAKQWVQLERGRATLHEPTAVEDNTLKRAHTNESVPDEETKKREDEKVVPDKFIEEEHRAKGGVTWSIYWRYIKAGTIGWWTMSLFVMITFRCVDVAQTWFIKAWGESYDTGKPKGIFHFLPPAAENVVPWLVTFFSIVTTMAFLFWITNLIMFGVGYHAAKHIFNESMERVAHATFRFYDVNPVGRLMNKLTSDMGTIDGGLSTLLTVFAWQFVGWISNILVILSSAPGFLVFGVILFCGFVYFFLRFLPTSQSLRRLEMVSLSPLMSNFGALVEGLTTVRAFKAQPRFQASMINVVDRFQRMDHFYWSLQAWLALRFSFMNASATFAMTCIALYTGISPGLTAFVLLTANAFVVHTEYMCKCYGQLEMDFSSVERVIELLDIETEKPGELNPPAHWPTFNGDVTFEDVTIRYAPNLDPALQNITLQIPGGSNTAIIGRTGSGKSTLALSLLATISAESGSIFIDGVDISKVNKQALRSRVTFLAQEPVLFPGSMRKNLDPLDEYSDAACESVLGKIADNHGWTLTTPIEAGGKGLSQGQRQLVGLARAMLRRSPVLIMDEATASIDFETAQKVQALLRDELKQSTVITIAHRLEAVKNADYCIVLGKGKLIKAGKAADMLKEGSEFSGMLA
ncbi:P-loop containing nucleoside triphosphate hydrolase protein [Dothidotthia symphoricarpi CBS 119687]|uniref:P-loop containing nucleoside triphosphate hydrolase protein n=1 Tax=Dothidotthia symphoricarpi CBS 119687 TaxID=1392245 RepID=A0A6A6A1S2_9PLEO|nr:P-loop containing nucleoside triphosphate hydrolase protein [Dothidotthia symphoricarpi CBS 119687]KAF2125145.1 P-loop containing nucleoside triphosphate hydrolase protein [Dothidotthia symphoricarpi CBS 119687]